MSKISVVIACVNGQPWIEPCLTALEEERSGVDSEIIVANCSTDGTSNCIRSRFPHVKLLEFSERQSIPELRAAGMEHASGDIIAITEDHCLVQKGWYEEILKAHELGYDVVGGSVENGCTDGMVNKAVFLCEYSHVMPPIPHGDVENVTGNNVSYTRKALNSVDESIKKNYWDYFLHEELKKKGSKFLSVPSIRVIHKKEVGLLHSLGQRFHYSRSFACMQRTRKSTPKLIFYAFLSPLLPFLVLWRITKQVFKKKRYKELFLSTPVLGMLLLCYACGEFAGYVFGPGKSLMKVE